MCWTAFAKYGHDRGSYLTQQHDLSRQHVTTCFQAVEKDAGADTASVRVRAIPGGLVEAFIESVIDERLH